MKYNRSEHVVLKTIVCLLIPFIVMYGLYIQLHGEYSPGGGFQAGVICAAAFIAYALVYGLHALTGIVSLAMIRSISALGVLLYGGVGIVCMAKGGEFLNYSVLHDDPVIGQQIGIVVIELGVGLTVFGVMMIIFYVFNERLK